MEKSLLLEAVRQLNESDLLVGTSVRYQAFLQFGALLERAKTLYPSRPDIKSLQPPSSLSSSDTFRDAIQRLLSALELRQPGTASDLAASIELPPDAPPGMDADLAEFQEAVALGLKKSALLLSGSIAEALLLARHPDKSEYGPGLSRLLTLAKEQRLFGRDTLRQLESLNDYRDLIHTRSGTRNRIILNDARIEHAAMALKLLCSELKEEDVRYSG
jgi:hypothetical protein